MKPILLGAMTLIILVTVTYSITTRTPSHERNWQDFSARTPDAIITPERITLKNVRNWNHTETHTVSQEWVDAVTIDPTTVTRVWFGLSNFSKISALGHTFLSFELENGEVYTLSIEARREAGEEYSAFKGLFNTYELLYGWGTERDYVGVRVHLLQQPIELYPLLLTEAEAAAVFRAVATETHQVAQSPRFYNTITSNCTNELTQSINKKYPGKIGYHIAHNLPGLSVAYLQDIGLIAAGPRKVIDPEDQQLHTARMISPTAYSEAIRLQLSY